MLDVMKNGKKNRLHVFERKVRREIYEPIYDQNIQERWKKYNQESTEMFYRPNMVNEVKRSELEWADHACRNKIKRYQEFF